MIATRILVVMAVLGLIVGCGDVPTGSNTELQPSDSPANTQSQSDGQSDPIPYFSVECSSNYIYVGHQATCEGRWILPFPVFSWSSSNPTVASVSINGVVTGLNIGTATITGVAIIDNTVHTDSVTIQVASPPPLQVSIVGPSTIHPFSQSCEWFANATGGASQKTYQWHKNGVPVSTNSSYRPQPPYTSGFELMVEVWDSDNGYSWSTRSIGIDLNSAYC